MRSEARIRCQVWQDPDFCALPRSAQGLYWMLLSQPDVTLAGTLPFMPARWEMLSAGGSLDSDLAILERARYILVDRTTHEVLIRTFARHDGVLRSEKTRAGMWSAWSAVFSPRLRRAFVDGLDPDLVAEAVDRSWVSQDALDALPDGVSPDTEDGVSPDTEDGVSPDTEDDGKDGVSPRAGAASASASDSDTTSLGGGADAPRERTAALQHTIARVCGLDLDGTTATGRAPLAKAAVELAAVDATTHEVEARAAEFRRRWPDATLTPMALAKHWGGLDPARDPTDPTKAERRRAGAVSRGRTLAAGGEDRRSVLAAIGLEYHDPELAAAAVEAYDHATSEVEA